PEAYKLGAHRANSWHARSRKDLATRVLRRAYVSDDPALSRVYKVLSWQSHPIIPFVNALDMSDDQQCLIRTSAAKGSGFAANLRMAARLLSECAYLRDELLERMA